MREYKAALGMRGDMLYCPLPLQINPYWTCEPDCAHCYSRRLNRTWGNDFRMADVGKIIKRLTSGRGTSPLSEALRQRKAIRIGGRADPFQRCEERYKVSTMLIRWLKEQNWETVIETKFPQRALDMTGMSPSVIMMPVIMVGMEKDWKLFEHEKTEHPVSRIGTLAEIQKAGYRVGVNGEPFIPGYHTEEQFEDVVELLKAHGINRFNTYNLHLNDYVAKNLCDLDLDIERIWRMNQDREWRKIQQRLLDIANKHDIILGCPDFVNTGWGDRQRANTCCGIDVENPCTWNAHHMKLAIQENRDPLKTWDKVGDYKRGVEIINGTARDMYTMKDVKWE